MSYGTHTVERGLVYFPTEDDFSEINCISLDQKNIYFVFKDYLPELNFNKNVFFDIQLREDIKVGYVPVLGSTHLKWSAPKGFYLHIVPRSGISKNTKIRIPNSPATIESSYRNEIKVMLENIGYGKSVFKDYGEDIIEVDDGVVIKKGVRIGQVILNCVNLLVINQEIPNICFIQDRVLYDGWEYLMPSNRQGGFGSTGLR